MTQDVKDEFSKVGKAIIEIAEAVNKLQIDVAKIKTVTKFLAEKEKERLAIGR